MLPEQDGGEAFALLRSLIQEVRLVPSNNTLLLELTGDLAGILTISDSSKTCRDAQDRALQIKVVAGVGFEPTTFRL
jgi:site-specific DNA recombinase